MKQTRPWELTVAQLVKKIPMPFIETEGVLPCSQELRTDAYPEPDKFNEHSKLVIL